MEDHRFFIIYGEQPFKDVLARTLKGLRDSERKRLIRRELIDYIIPMEIREKSPIHDNAAMLAKELLERMQQGEVNEEQNYQSRIAPENLDQSLKRT